ncbi:MAG TPA: hypothetical protein VGF32_24095 [Streptosporangiaceae bacterium]
MRVPPADPQVDQVEMVGAELAQVVLHQAAQLARGGLQSGGAARRLGTSLHTYRRRVAELMAALEAGSRFQAGVRAGELGLAH